MLCALDWLNTLLFIITVECHETTYLRIRLYLPIKTKTPSGRKGRTSFQNRWAMHQEVHRYYEVRNTTEYSSST